MTAAITREKVLDELAGLAAIEHALCVDYLLVHYALQTATGSAPAQDAAQKAFSMAQDAEMHHLARVNRLLVASGRPPVVDRAAQVTLPSGEAVAVGVLTPGRFEEFPDVEQAVASAVDERYTRLGEAVAAAGDRLDPEFVGELSFVLLSVARHADEVDALDALVGDVDVGTLLADLRTEPADDHERDLLALSNSYYDTVVANVGASLAHDSAIEGQLLFKGISTMTTLHEVNGILVARGLVPSFDLTAA